jgi:hypothetical protein
MKASSICQVCQKTKPTSQLVPCEIIRPSLADTIKSNFPEFNPAGFVCVKDKTNEHLEKSYLIISQHLEVAGDSLSYLQFFWRFG